MTETGKKILVVSPTPSHPQNAGNRARIYRMLKSLQQEGHEIHYLLADMEYGSRHVKTQVDMNGMRSDWDSVFTTPIFGFQLPGFLKAQEGFSIIERKLRPLNILLRPLRRVNKLYYFTRSKAWYLKKFYYPFWRVNKLYYFAKGKAWHLKKPYYFLESHLWKIKRPYYFTKSAPSRFLRFLSPTFYVNSIVA